MNDSLLHKAVELCRSNDIEVGKLLLTDDKHLQLTKDYNIITNMIVSSFHLYPAYWDRLAMDFNLFSELVARVQNVLSVIASEFDK